ncbi:hypothetical protein SAMN04488168_12341 [Bacillus sp. 491mf]|uniref:hypothetical protein n=1 Tax=Bacillus sp. 491mf TaxID=1761755 RepID=UPI0008ED9D80|nr:hypothetical protein [Bacillus sp. 491mf]SFD18492.1 hypothetical protein SAMN04488168_12341 [Bacillus sp. 491mf]
MKIKKSTLFLWGTVGVLILAIGIIMLFGKEDKPSKVTQANQSKTSQQITHQEKPSTQQPQAKEQDPKQQDSNTKDLEVGNVKKDGITSNENEDVEQVKKLALDFFHQFNEKNVAGIEAEKVQNDLYEKIKQMFSKDSLEKYSAQEIAKYYEKNNLYSFLGKGENSLVDFKLKEVSIELVDYVKDAKMYRVAVIITTKQVKGYTALGIMKEGQEYKIVYAPDVRFDLIK